MTEWLRIAYKTATNHCFNNKKNKFQLYHYSCQKKAADCNGKVGTVTFVPVVAVSDVVGATLVLVTADVVVSAVVVTADVVVSTDDE